MRIPSSLPAALGVLATIVACSGSDESGSGTSSDAVTQQTIEAVASVICDKIEECTSPIAMRTVFGGSATCKKRQAQQLGLEVHSAGYLGTEAQAQACKNGLAAAPCKDIFAGIPVKECQVPGSLADGASCTGDGQCASRSCFVADNATCGSCGKRAAEGADCTNAKCEAGLECDSKKKCVKPGAEGAACGGPNDPPCEALLHCGEGKCQKGLTKGADCKLGDDALPCDFFKGLVCIPTSLSAGKCEEVAVATVGEACDVVSTAPLKYALCESSDCIDKKCVAKIADGESCTEGGASSCQEPAKCRNGKCALRDPNQCK